MPRSPFLVPRAQGGGSASWLAYAAGGVTPGLVSDFAGGRFRNGSGSTDFATLFGGAARSGPAVQHDAAGNLVWAPHNLVTDSASPASQDVPVVIGARYRVECTGQGSVMLSGAGTGTVTPGAGLEITAASGTLTLGVSGQVAALWCHRSDLGGMAEVPLAERADVALPRYLPTDGAARYLLRLQDHRPAPGLFWIGDSFLNNDTLPQVCMALIDPTGMVGHHTDGVGGSNLPQQAARFAAADPAEYEKTLVIMDGGLSDTAGDAIAAIADMVGRLGHARWVYVQPAPFSAPDAAMLQTWAEIRAFVGEAHYVETWPQALALSDGSPEDEARVNAGLWPLSLTLSDTDFHPNAAGRDLLAARIRDRLQQRGDLGNGAARVAAGIRLEKAATNLITHSLFGSATPPDWTVFLGTGARELTELHGAPAVRVTCTSQRDGLYQTFDLTPGTTYTASARVRVLEAAHGDIFGVFNLGDVTGTTKARVEDIVDGYVSITFTTGTDVSGDLRFGVGLDNNRTGDIVFSEVQLETGQLRSSWVPTLAGTQVRSADPVLTIPAGQLPFSGGMPAAVGLAMRGRMTYADTGNALELRPLTWQVDGDNLVHYYLRTDGTRTGQPQFRHRNGGVSGDVNGAEDAFAPGVEVGFALASRVEAGGIGGAIGGAVLAQAPGIGMPDLSTAALQLGQEFAGHIESFALWVEDIGDAGLAEATG